MHREQYQEKRNNQHRSREAISSLSKGYRNRKDSRRHESFEDGEHSCNWTKKGYLFLELFFVALTIVMGFSHRYLAWLIITIICVIAGAFTIPHFRDIANRRSVIACMLSDTLGSFWAVLPFAFAGCSNIWEELIGLFRSCLARHAVVNLTHSGNYKNSIMIILIYL